MQAIRPPISRERMHQVISSSGWRDGIIRVEVKARAKRYELLINQVGEIDGKGSRSWCVFIRFMLGLPGSTRRRCARGVTREAAAGRTREQGDEECGFSVAACTVVDKQHQKLAENFILGCESHVNTNHPKLLIRKVPCLVLRVGMLSVYRAIASFYFRLC